MAGWGHSTAPKGPDPVPTQLTADDARQSLTAHVAARGVELYQKFGPNIGWTELLRVLEDRAFCRYSCEIVFDAWFSTS